MRDSQVRKHSPELSRIEQLPDDVLLNIISFLPTLADMAKTSNVCRKWRKMWYGVTSLNFDATALPVLKTEPEWYVQWVNTIIDTRVTLPGLAPVKELRIKFELNTRQRSHIERWIWFAIANRVESLHLEFSFSLCGPVYKLSEKHWTTAPSGLSSLECLKSLSLVQVSVTKQFIEFILSNCPLLEDLALYLYQCGEFNNLDVSGAPPLRLRRLNMVMVKDYGITKLCAPHLTSLFYESEKFSPQKIDVPMLNDLSIGGFGSIMKYLGHFWSYLPQLERLHLIMKSNGAFVLKPIPELINLKYLMISIVWKTGYYFCEIIDFIRACSLLETFALEILHSSVIFGGRSIYVREKNWQRIGPGCSFDSLKTLKLYGGHGRTIDHEIIEFIIAKSPNLKKLIIHKSYLSTVSLPRKLSKTSFEEYVKADAKKLCEGRPNEIEITVIG